MKNIIISAMARNRVIGKEGSLPWNIAEEYQHFKKTTYGHPLLMGRNTYQEDGKNLTGRFHIVVTRQEDFHVPGDNTKVVHTIEEGLEFAKTLNDDKLFIIGGGAIYRQALERGIADEMILSYLHFDAEGDTTFPAFDDDDWEITDRDKRAEFEIVYYRKKSENE